MSGGKHRPTSGNTAASHRRGHTVNDERRARVRESLRQNGQQLADVLARADHNGVVQPPPPPADEDMQPPTVGTPHAKVGAGEHRDPPPPTMQERINDAIRRGDTATALALTNDQLRTAIDERNNRP